MAAINLLNAVTSTGAGTIRKSPRLVHHHVFQADITGGPSAVTFTLEGSLDGATFDTISTHAFSAGQLTNTMGIFIDVDKPLMYFRANLTVLTGGTAPTVTVIHEGEYASKVNRQGEF